MNKYISKTAILSCLLLCMQMSVLKAQSVVPDLEERERICNRFAHDEDDYYICLYCLELPEDEYNDMPTCRENYPNVGEDLPVGTTPLWFVAGCLLVYGAHCFVRKKSTGSLCRDC